MAAYFSAEHIAKLRQAHQEVHEKFAELRQRYIIRNYKSERAREFATHGFGRRLGTLVRAIDQVYEILPPEREDIRNAMKSLTQRLQSSRSCSIRSGVSITWHGFGCTRRISREKREMNSIPKGLDLAARRFVLHFPTSFALIYSRRKWLENLKDFRIFGTQNSALHSSLHRDARYSRRIQSARASIGRGSATCGLSGI